MKKIWIIILALALFVGSCVEPHHGQHPPTPPVPPGFPVPPPPPPPPAP